MGIVTWLLGLSLLNGFCYWLGGETETKIRDLGCPTVILFTLWKLGLWHWSLLCCFPLMFGALTTYWKKKETDARWWNWMLHGFFISLSLLPFIFFSKVSWHGYIAYVATLTFLMTLISELISNAFWEQFMRGVLITGFLWLFLI